MVQKLTSDEVTVALSRTDRAQTAWNSSRQKIKRVSFLMLKRILFRAKRLRQWIQSTLIAREPVDSPSVNVSAKPRDRTLCALLAIVREIEIICLKAESENMTGFFQVAVQATQQQVRAAAQRIVLDTDAIMLNTNRHLVPFL